MEDTSSNKLVRQSDVRMSMSSCHGSPMHFFKILFWSVFCFVLCLRPKTARNKEMCLRRKEISTRKRGAKATLKNMATHACLLIFEKTESYVNHHSMCYLYSLMRNSTTPIMEELGHLNNFK